MGRLSLQTRSSILCLLRIGKSQREVAKMLNVCQSSISHVWKTFCETGEIKDKPKSGRPRKASSKDTRLLCRISTANPHFTAKQVYAESNLGLDVTMRTIRSYLNQGGLFGRIAARKQLLNKGHIRKRILWCKQYSAFSDADWKKVIFSDESKVELVSSRRCYVRRRTGQRYKLINQCKTLRFGGSSIMVWGCLKGDGSRKLIRCPHRLDSSAYQRVLQEGLSGLHDEESIFMQDGAPCHRSKSTQMYLDRQNICLMVDWPPLSPDLNIIENVWSILKANVYKHNCKTLDSLWDALQKEWYLIPNDLIFTLYKSIPTRIKEVLKNKGQPINY